MPKFGTYGLKLGADYDGNELLVLDDVTNGVTVKSPTTELASGLLVVTYQALFDGKSDTSHNHDGRYEPLLSTTIVSNLGAIYPWDVSSAGAIDGTLTQNCTLSFTGWGASAGEQLRTLYIRGGNAWSVMWPTIAWENGSPPTLDNFTIVTVGTLDGGATLFGIHGDFSTLLRPTGIDWRDITPAPVFDATLLTDLALNSNTTATSAVFSSAAINGKQIVGNGIPAGTTLTWASGTTATLSHAATRTGTNLRAVIGTDNTSSFNAFIAALQAADPVNGYIYGAALIGSAPSTLGASNGIRLYGRGGILTTEGPFSGVGAAGTAYPTTLPPSTLVIGQQSPTIGSGTVTIANNSQTLTISGNLSDGTQFDVTKDIGVPVVGTNIPAGAHIVGVTSATVATLSHKATGTSAGTYTIGRPFLNAYESNDFAIEDLAVLNLSPLFKGIKVSAQSRSTGTSHGGFRAARCTIGDWDISVVSGFGLHTGRQWGPRIDNVHFWGCDVQLMCCNDGSFANNLVATACVFDRYGTVGIRNLSEATSLIGPGFGFGDDGHCQAIDGSNGAQGPGTTIDGSQIVGAWCADRGGTGAWIRLYGLNSSGNFAVHGWRGGLGATADTLIQLGASMIALDISDVTWAGGSFVDFNGFTCPTVRVAGSPALGGHTDPPYQNVPTASSNNTPNGVATIPSVSNGAYVYTNTTSAPQVLYIDGGTVSTIVKGGVQLWSSSGRPVYLNPGESVTINNTVAPNIRVDSNRL